MTTPHPNHEAFTPDPANQQPTSDPPVQESPWQGPANFWTAYPVGFAAFGAVAGLVIIVALMIFVAPDDADVTALAALTNVVGFAGTLAGIALAFGLLLVAVLRVVGGGKIGGLVAVLAAGGVGALIAWQTGMTPMWGFLLGFFGAAITMGIGQAVATGVFFRRPRAVRVGAIVLGALIVVGVPLTILTG